MQIAVISDTHMPRGDAAAARATCVGRLRAADLIVHAGDLVRLAVLRELESYGPVIAVHGNRRRRRGAGVVAGGGVDRGGRRDDRARARRRPGEAGGSARLRRRFPDADAVVFGHSHIPLHERAPDGFQIFNPGSPTERRRAPRHTMGIATILGGRVSFELIAVG